MEKNPFPANPTRPFNSWRDRRVELALFLIAGLIQTVASYFLFERAGDHDYFVAVANGNLPAMNDGFDSLFSFKEMIREIVFYLLASPSRWLGGGDLAHILWMRLLTLAGFVFAYTWVRRINSVSVDQTLGSHGLNRFLLLCLLYPGQLAWTGSLLRDGISCTLLFVGLLAWSDRRRILSLVVVIASLALRPEFGIVMVVLFFSMWLAVRFDIRKYRFSMMLAVVAIIAILAYDQRTLVSEFSQLAFQASGMAYPTIDSRYDIVGYFNVVLQAILDPLTTSTILSSSLFQLAEVLFFIWVAALSLRTLTICPPQTAGLIIGVFVCMWLFAYFEIFVSGFSRHRMALIILLLAVVSLQRKPTRQAVEHSLVAGASDVPPDLCRT